jgi:hypothetical protein
MSVSGVFMSCRDGGSGGWGAIVESEPVAAAAAQAGGV